MWFEFLRASIVGLLLLYVPGYAFLRGLRLSRVLSLCAAPLYITAVCSVLPIAYYELDVPCGVGTVLVPAIMFAFILWAIRRIRTRKGNGDNSTVSLCDMQKITVFRARMPFDVVIPAIIVCLAAIVCICVFLSVIPGADAFNPRYDNQTHLNLARAYLESGKWSSLHSSTFLASPANASSDANLNVFYPGAWTCIVVLTSLISCSDLMVSINAVVALTSIVAFPLGMYAFIRVLLPHNRRAVALSAIAITGFSHWPWLYVVTGPLFPNQYGIALQFAALAVVLAAIGNDARRHWPSLVVFCAAAFCALALTHPSTLFSSYVFMAFYGAHVILRSPFFASKPRAVHALVLLAYFAAIAGFWAFCLQLPMLQSTIGYTEVIQDDPARVLYDFARMRFSFIAPQLGMALASALGCIRAFRRKDLRWLLGPIAYFAVGYVATRIDWWIVKHWLTSLWYSDWRRMCANMTLYLMPLTALGLDTILPTRLHTSQRAWTMLRVTTFCAILLTIYTPSLDYTFMDRRVEGSLARMSTDIRNRFSELIFAPDEVAFVRKAKDTIPSNALVINSPADGSMWAYGVCDMNAYFRSILTPGLTDDANLIRERLKDYAVDSDVQDAVRRTGAAYVLQLDKGVPYAEGHWLWQYTEDRMDNWRGIDGIDEETPGYSVVLAEGSEMRLYRIEGME